MSQLNSYKFSIVQFGSLGTVAIYFMWFVYVVVKTNHFTHRICYHKDSSINYYRMEKKQTNSIFNILFVIV